MLTWVEASRSSRRSHSDQRHPAGVPDLHDRVRIICGCRRIQGRGHGDFQYRLVQVVCVDDQEGADLVVAAVPAALGRRRRPPSLRAQRHRRAVREPPDGRHLPRQAVRASPGSTTGGVLRRPGMVRLSASETRAGPWWWAVSALSVVRAGAARVRRILRRRGRRTRLEDEHAAPRIVSNSESTGLSVDAERRALAGSGSPLVGRRRLAQVRRCCRLFQGASCCAHPAHSPAEDRRRDSR